MEIMICFVGGDYAVDAIRVEFDVGQVYMDRDRRELFQIIYEDQDGQRH